MSTCQLCQREAKLLRSHIFPKHIYRDILDDKGRFLAITNTGKTRLRQHGLWDKLLCEDCEQLLSTEYEDQFADFWLNKMPLPDSLPQALTLEGIDYLKFKLYHLSILFRASVTAQDTFALVDLGPHEDIIRNLLLNQEDDLRYQILAFALTKKDDSVVKGLMGFPQRMSFDGHTFYLTIYAGCAWMVKVSSHELKGLGHLPLKPQGTMTVMPKWWRSFTSVQMAGTLLKQGKGYIPEPPTP